MKIQTICKDQNTNNNPCCQNINLFLPDGVGVITNRASYVNNFSKNPLNPCNTPPHPVFEASLYDITETQFGLHIRNKVNKWSFAQIANPDSISLIFETSNSKRQLSLYEDKVTICDGNVESPIATLTDLFTIGLIDENGKPNTSFNLPDLSDYATKEDVEDIERLITALQNDNDNLQSKVSDLEAKLEDVEGFTSYLEDENKELQNKISDLEAQIADILQQIANL
ncbi:MAG: hypothetical protein FWC41_07515 [Firmicutes bacterium]|nr:hypothetical protein [Bacillota bacterium]